MDTGALGKIYEDGEIIVIQQGKVEVVMEEEGNEVILAERGEGDFFGEMAIFDQDVRSATVRAKGQVRALTVDKKNFLRRIQALFISSRIPR